MQSDTRSRLMASLYSLLIAVVLAVIAAVLPPTMFRTLCLIGAVFMGVVVVPLAILFSVAEMIAPVKEVPRTPPAEGSDHGQTRRAA